MQNERLIMKWWVWVCGLFALLIVVLGICWTITAIKGEYVFKLEMNEYMKDAMVSYASTYNNTPDCPTVQSSLIQKDWCKSGYIQEDIKEQGDYTAIVCRKIPLSKGVQVIS
jgi:hypothetical protein